MKRYETFSSEETQLLGRKLVSQVAPGDVVALEGGLGSGKTELVRGFMKELNPKAIVRSPSFSLVNTYECDLFPVSHFDFYRLNSPDELFEIGYEEYINPDTVCLIEWAQMFEESLPSNTKFIKFVEAEGDRRVIESDVDLG